MQAMKVVHLHKDAITGFVSIGRYIVTGDAIGFLRFYDHRLGLVGWLEELNSGVDSDLPPDSIPQHMGGFW